MNSGIPDLPYNLDSFQTSIWGLSKQGKTCKPCGLSVHNRCELKVPAECAAIGGQGESAMSVARTSSSVSKAPAIRRDKKRECIVTRINLYLMKPL